MANINIRVDDDLIAKVKQLLNDGIDLKLQKCTNGGRNCFEEAYKIADAEPNFLGALRAITSYRLAHVLMRTAKQDTELERAEQLFAEAERYADGSLGALPRLYRLAIRIRRGEREQEFFKNTIEAFQNFEKLEKPREAGSRHKQKCWVNQLELLAYVAGFDYHPLQGLNPLHNVFDDLNIGNGFRIVGAGRELSQFLMPKSVAIKQAQELLAQYDTSHNKLLFVVSKDGADYYKNGLNSPQHEKRSWIGLLPLLLEQENEGIDRLKLRQTTNSEENLRKNIERLKDFLSLETGVEQIYLENKPRLKLNPSLAILTVISDQELNKFKKDFCGEKAVTLMSQQ